MVNSANDGIIFAHSTITSSCCLIDSQTSSTVAIFLLAILLSEWLVCYRHRHRYIRKRQDYDCIYCWSASCLPLCDMYKKIIFSSSPLDSRLQLSRGIEWKRQNH